MNPRVFKKHALPLFLEGIVHALRVEDDQSKARGIYENTKKSELFDKKLGMYLVNADLSKEPEEIGRASIFPPGWLENQSVWLHMEYKFIVELLRCGLYKEFYENFKSTLIPFLEPRRYGRSILENSSFIVSSAHEDASLHGRGFVARLSGSTAEFLHIWLLMNAGEKPFYLDKKGQVNLILKPVLPGWLFTQKESTVDFLDKKGEWQEVKIPKDTYAFNFLGSTLVVYHNLNRRDTFGSHPAVTQEIILTYPGQKQITIASQNIPSDYALDVRRGKVERIDVFLE